MTQTDSTHVSLADILAIPEIVQLIGRAISGPSAKASFGRTNHDANQAVQGGLAELKVARLSWLYIVLQATSSSYYINYYLLYHSLLEYSNKDIGNKFHDMLLLAMEPPTDTLYDQPTPRLVIWDSGDDDVGLVNEHMIYHMSNYLLDARCTEEERKVIQNILLSYMQDRQYMRAVLDQYQYALVTNAHKYLNRVNRLGLRHLGNSILTTLQSEIDNKGKLTGFPPGLLRPLHTSLQSNIIRSFAAAETAERETNEEAERSNPITCSIL